MKSILLMSFAFLTFSSCDNKQENGIISRDHSYSSSEAKDLIYSTDEENEDEDNEEYPDDTYCAEVDYYNPNTGTHSNYTLTVEVQSNEIVEINFPNGGWLDNDHFSGAELESDGTASFISDRGYFYDIKIVGRSSNCIEDVPRAVQCRGETEDGDQCENLTDNPNGLCWQHQDQE